MNEIEIIDNQVQTWEEQLVGVNAKTGPCLTARGWSGGRRRILGKGAMESYTYHVMSRTCGGEVFFENKMPGIQL